MMTSDDFRALRVRLGLSQIELAAKLEIGARTVQKIEAGQPVTVLMERALRDLSRESEMLALLVRLEPFLDAIVCFASDMGEHEPNQIAHDVRAAIAELAKVQAADPVASEKMGAGL